MECGTAKAAMRLTWEHSGRSLYSVASECGISDTYLSRCLNVHDSANLPHDKVAQFLASCGNATYLRWLHLTTVKLMPELDNDDGACIASEIDTLRLLLTETIDQIKEAAQPPTQCKECGAHFALSGLVVPRWLLAEVALIEQEIGRL
jgi:hypothetical protein